MKRFCQNNLRRGGGVKFQNKPSLRIELIWIASNDITFEVMMLSLTLLKRKQDHLLKFDNDFVRNNCHFVFIGIACVNLIIR